MRHTAESFALTIELELIPIRETIRWRASAANNNVPNRVSALIVGELTRTQTLALRWKEQDTFMAVKGF